MSQREATYVTSDDETRCPNVVDPRQAVNGGKGSLDKNMGAGHLRHPVLEGCIGSSNRAEWGGTEYVRPGVRPKGKNGDQERGEKRSLSTLR